MTRPLHVVVMKGGPGAERDVSLRSGTAVATALRSIGYAVTEMDPQHRAFELPSGTNVVFLALHGAYGEDGTIQQQLDALGVPYTGCGPDTSRVAFDKALSKERFVSAGVATPAFEIVESVDAPWPAHVDLPAVVKPVCQGSSVGLCFISTQDEWRAALEECLRHDRRALLESKVEGKECTVSILDGETLPIVEVKPHSGVYDFQSKYTAGATEYRCPAAFPDSVTAAVQAAGLAAFEALGGGDYCRVDVILDPQNTPYVLEVNTLPGMTPTSLLPKAAAAAGMEYATLCERMVLLALKRTSAGRRPRATATGR